MEGNPMAASSHVFVGIKGMVLALDRATGEEVWRSPLAGADFVNVTLLDGDLFAAARGELFALETSTGKILWHNPLKGLGRGLLTIAGGLQQAVPMAEKKRRDAQAAAAAGAAAGA
jgi:outer membrane protein assembly factor BamB